MAGRRGRPARSPCSEDWRQPRPGPGATVLRAPSLSPTRRATPHHRLTAAAVPGAAPPDMGSVRLYAAALLLLAACCCLCQPALGRPSSQSQRRLRSSSNSHYCGSHLATMLEMICGVGGGIGKRADTNSKPTVTGNMHDYSGDQRQNELGGMVRALEFPSYNSRPRLLEAVDPLGGGPRRESRSLHPGGPDRVRVKRQGIVYECCFNACSIQVLQTYCNS